MTNIKNETSKPPLEAEVSDDLVGFEPSPPAHRIDDKAATLEDELQDLKLRFNRERFMYLFILVVFFVLLVGPSLSGMLLGFLITASLIFTMSAGNYLDSPWAVAPLERWHELWYKFCEKKLLGKKDEPEIEPRDD